MLGEGYTPEDEEDSSTAEVTAVHVYQVRGRHTFHPAFNSCMVFSGPPVILGLVHLLNPKQPFVHFPPSFLPHRLTPPLPSLPPPPSLVQLQARYRVPVSRATAGNLVLIEGVDATITKTATLVADAYEEPVCIFRCVGLSVNVSCSDISPQLIVYPR